MFVQLVIAEVLAGDDSWLGQVMCFAGQKNAPDGAFCRRLTTAVGIQPVNRRFCLHDAKTKRGVPAGGTTVLRGGSQCRTNLRSGTGWVITPHQRGDTGNMR